MGNTTREPINTHPAVAPGRDTAGQDPAAAAPAYGLTAAGLLLGAVLAACGPTDEPAAPAAVSEESSTAVDLILTNGKVLTVDADFSIHDTVVVDEGLIVATGGTPLLEEYSAAEVVDLQGKVLMPGFIDSHTHIRGRPNHYIELSEVGSVEEIRQLVAAKAEQVGPGNWVTGYGWSEDQLSEARRPLRDDLDAAALDNPVILTRAGGHSAVANSMALELADVTPDTPDPEGGVIERNPDGSLNGVIRERQNIVTRLVPAATEEEMVASLEVNLNNLLADGITSILDASKPPSEYAVWEQLYAAAELPLPRAALQFQWHDPPAIAAVKERVGDGNEMLKIGPIKVFSDGGFTGPAAYTKEPYRDQGDYHGHLEMPEEELVAHLNEIHDAGWQMGIHAIGDAAIELVVDILAGALERNPRPDHRHFLNHFSMRPSDETMETMARHGIAITQQPNFTYTLEGRYVANLDGWRLQHNNPLRSPMDFGVTVAISSDILPIGPMVGLYAAVTRKGMSGEVYAEEEAITMEEAIRGYTQTGAWLLFEEDVKGSLEPGKYADMILLSDDLLTIDPERIMEVEVERTWLAGRLVYARP